MKACFVLLSLIAMTFGHSQMRCLNYVNGQCTSGIRSETNSFNSQAYRYPFASNGAVCQAATGNPLTSGYGSSGSSPMGQLTPGQSINIMWYARNHAVDNQKPGNVSIYVSGIVPLTGASDPSMSTFMTQPVCTVPYAGNCGPTGDAVPCTATCKVPSNLATGYYTFAWYWDWRVNDGNIYTTCADAYVSSSNVATPETSTKQTTTSQQTSAATSAQTSNQNQNPSTSTRTSTSSTTAAQVTTSAQATTSSGGVDPTTCTKACKDLCGDRGVNKCDCSNGYNIVCAAMQDDSTSSSSRLIAGVMAVATSSLYFL